MSGRDRLTLAFGAAVFAGDVAVIATHAGVLDGVLAAAIGALGFSLGVLVATRTTT